MNHTPIDNLQLNTPLSQVTQTLGQPTRQKQTDDALILQYGSVAPSLSHLLYFQNDRLAVKSIFIGSQKTLSDYLGQYGQPQQSLFKAAPSQHDSFRQVIHIWPQQGLAITSAGSDPSSPIFRVDEFLPTSMKNYLATWGKNLIDHPVATISGTPKTIQAPPTKTVEKPQSTSGLALATTFTVLLTGIILVLVKSKLYARQESRNST